MGVINLCRHCVEQLTYRPKAQSAITLCIGLPHWSLGDVAVILKLWSANTCYASSSITMTSQWAWWRLRSPASRLFTQPFIQTQIKENIKAPRHWPLNGEFTRTGEFPAQRDSYAEYVSIWWRHHVMSTTWNCSQQSGGSPNVVALFLLQTLVAIWYDFVNCMIQSKWNQIIQESTIII